MAIVFPIAPPLDTVNEIDVSEFNATNYSTSPFTGRGRVQSFEGEYWSCTLRYRNLNRQDGQAMLAFRSALRGSEGTFVTTYPGNPTSLGMASQIPSSPEVDGSGLEGSDRLAIRSAPESIDSWLLAGDIIQVGPSDRPHWHRVLGDVNTDISGRAVFDVWPVIREGTQDGDQVDYEQPLCLFRQISEVDSSIRSPVIYNFDIIAREEI